MIGAMTFGVELPGGWQAFPSSPTWLLHNAGEAVKRCYANVPVLIRASTLCQVQICSVCADQSEKLCYFSASRKLERDNWPIVVT